MKQNAGTSVDIADPSDMEACVLKIYSSKFLGSGQCALLVSNKSNLRQSLIAIQSQLQKRIESLNASNTLNT